MKRQTGVLVRGRLATVAVVIAAAIASNHSASAGGTNVKASYDETFVSANFSYDGASPATLGSHSGYDNIGGRFTGQMLAEYFINGNPCKAPDGTDGVEFVLVQARLADNYHQGQLYATGTGAADGSGCAGTTGRVSETLTLTVTGGSGRFDHASGLITLNFIAQVLAGGSSPGELFGDTHVIKTGQIAY